MTYKRHFITLLILIGASYSFAAVPVTVEVLEVNKIWDRAPHNAFTDLVRWNDTFYCAFREGRGHVSTDGKIRILRSKDADAWESGALISLAGFDLRDAHLSVTLDNRLMLIGGAAPREKDNQSAPTGTFVSFSKDGEQWTKSQIVVEPGRWLWCVTWHKGKAYGVSYTAGQGDNYLELLVSTDGIHYKTHVERLFEQGRPSEVTLRFDTDGTCYALVRRDRSGSKSSSAILGISSPDYTQWQWMDLGPEFNGFGGPNFIRIPGGYWIAAGRMHAGGAHTALTYLDVEKGTMTKLTKLPSGGDTSYPGLVCYEDVLYVSYYSSHEGKTSIYLAKVKIALKPAGETTAVVTPETRIVDGEVESVTLETIREMVARNEALLNPIKMAYTVKKSRIGERMVSGRGKRVSGRSFSHINCVWAQTGDKHYAREDYFYGPNESARSTVKVIEPERVTEGKLPDLMEGTIHPRDDHDWYSVLVAKLGLRPFEGHYTLSQILVPEYASLHTKTEIIDGRETYVVDVKRPTIPAYFARIWIDRQRGMPLRIQYFDKHPNWFDSRRVSEIKDIKLYQLPNSGWIPIQGVRSINFSQDNISYEHMTVDVNSITIKHDDIPESLFNIKFPMGAKVYDRNIGTVTEVFSILLGKSLPDFENIKVDFTSEQAKNKMLLLCFFDIEQRPSRNYIIQIAKQVKDLEQKGVVIVAIHSLKVDKNTLHEWIEKNGIPFPVGIIQGDNEKAHFKWGIKSLPWLILTDRQHIVINEGFGIDDLGDQIRQIAEKNR